jgi:UDP-3-O-[3-hydroxymyristoyl] N-acetylglucosamine deacetylase
LNNRLLRELLANESAWEMVTFDDPVEVPIIFMQPASAN